MRPPSEPAALRQVAERLADLLGLSSTEAVTHEPRSAEVDAILDIGGRTFVVEWKGAAGLPSVSRAASQVQQYASEVGGGATPLVTVPFMGSVGDEYCREAGVSWLDLSGNAFIVAPGLRVRIGGKPNRFKRRGRPSSAFAPKSSRIARWLLLHPRQAMTQREVARATNMDEGFTSRIVARLEEDDLIVREPSGAIRVRAPDLLLDAWREDYDFSKHRIVKGHVPARSGDELIRRLADELRDHGTEHAATGMAAAWLFTRFAAFRIVASYVAEMPSAEVLDRLSFRQESRGANVWLVVPADQGVFHGAGDRGGVRCVHPVQAYLDLKEHPERADEAAAQLRAELLTWGADD